MTVASSSTVWEHGRFDARRGTGKVLFGRMYEDTAIETRAFAKSERIFCIASAGCTAMALAAVHDVVAVDINAVQLAYAQRRFAGEYGCRGAAENFMALGRAFAPLVGWRRAQLTQFLELEDPARQTIYWERVLDTRRFRVSVDGFLSLATLRTVYAASFLDFLPSHLGSVMRGRMARCFGLHANRTNPHARALLLGEFADVVAPPEAKAIRAVHADAAGFLEEQPQGSFGGFAISNILDGATPIYRDRLYAAIRRAAAPDAVVVQRSFREPPTMLPENHAADDRAMLWGIVEVKPAADLVPILS
jgi:S-adenosylmethionine:diacylglycerol 3-amino-3-carboxypropyl transferase